MKPIKTIQRFIAEHYIALIFVCLTGLIAGLPQVIAKHALGSAYQGIPYLVNDSEGEYLSRIHEILDGHFSDSSPVLYEYKDSVTLIPPTSEFVFYVLPAKFTGLSMDTVVFSSKFFYPALLCLFVYLFILSLLDRKDKAAKLSAIAGAFFVTIGYDSIDYRSFVAHVLHGSTTYTNLIWTRLVNPITGAMLLFAFLWLFVRALRSKDRYLSIAGASILLALSSGYIFSLALSLTVSVLVAIGLLMQKKRRLALRACIPVVTAVLVNGIYFFGVAVTLLHHSVTSDPRKSGLFYTHVPATNLISYATLIFVALCFFFYFKKDTNTEKDWWYFSLASVVACVAVYSQQILTGRAVWPQHFVQYTAPLCAAILVVFVHNIFRSRLNILWRGVLVVLFTLSAFSAWLMFSTVQYSIPQYADQQTFAPVFNYLNAHAPKDCVVYMASDYGDEINRFIPGFTSCNVYHSFYIYNGVPAERVMHNFLVNLRLRQIPLADVKQHFYDNRMWTQAYFFRDWGDLFCCSDKWLNEIGSKVEIDQWFASEEQEIEKEYASYLKGDLYSELTKYHLDYMLVDPTLQPQVNPKNFPFLVFQAHLGRFDIYTLKAPTQ